MDIFSALDNQKAQQINNTLFLSNLIKELKKPLGGGIKYKKKREKRMRSKGMRSKEMRSKEMRKTRKSK